MIWEIGMNTCKFLGKINMLNKIVYLCDESSVYNINLISQIQKQNYSVDIISQKSKVVKTGKNKLKHKLCVYKGFYELFKKYTYRARKQHILHVQFVAFETLYFLPLYMFRFKKVILTFWGSDLLRQSKTRLFLLLPVFLNATKITFETEQMSGIFLKLFPFLKNKVAYTRFGLSEINHINSATDENIKDFCEKYKISSNKSHIILGYNRNVNQQHIKVIDSFPSDLCEKEMQVIIPWTYGPNDEEYKSDLIRKLQEKKLDYIFIKNFLTDLEVACLRKITDILVQVQTTDSFSSTMLETLYCKKNVITGSWLPYSFLFDLGIKMNRVDSVEKTGNMITNVLNKMNSAELENNSSIIQNNCSWDACLSMWTNLYI